MQIKSSRHGFANAGLVIMLAVGWAWLVDSSLATVNAATEPEGAAAAARSQAKQSASNPRTQGEDVQAQVGQVTVEDDPSGVPVMHHFVATAYCVKGPTASGLRVRSGMIAADPRILPQGSIVRVVAGEYSGIYTVLDTGPLITGRKIDIFMPNYQDAVGFGRRKIKLQIIRYGWNPAAEGSEAAKR